MEKGCDSVPVCGFGQTEINKWWKPNADLILQIGRAIRVAPIIFRGICGNGVDRRASRFSQVYSIQTVYHSDRESPVVVVFQEAWSLALRDQMRSPTMKVVLLNYRTNCTWEMQFLISQQWTIMNPVTRCLMELIQKPSFRSSSD